MNSNRRGSALLIVLGMLAFMVVSAVAFSMFMRQSRLPSSFVRQKAISSQLVKAGLAESMRRIDDAIADNPYPGIGTIGNKNYWVNRVLFENLSSANKANSNSADSDDDDISDANSQDSGSTISTLNLEALAYLPPPLINTVRYLSRKTPTAKWCALDYDAGRYAFTAVNVSDYFDINRMRANVMRDSSSTNRISMAYLFENEDHTSFATQPQLFDSFIDKTRQDSFQTRLISLADYNLAIGTDNGQSQYGNVGFKSPFVEYIKGNYKDGFTYNGTETSAKMQKFVTDSWHPATNSSDLVLTDAEAQPLEGLGDGLDPLMKNGSAGFNEIKKHLNLPERAALKDYLDEDNIPTSLVMPTLERTPMITGLRFTFSNKDCFKFKVARAEDKVETVPGTENTPTKTITQKLWTIDGFSDTPTINVSVNAIYPFKRQSGLDNLKTSYDIDVLIRAYLVKEDSDLSRTRIDNEWGNYWPGGSDWKSEINLLGQGKGFISLYGKGSISVSPSGIVSEDSALIRATPIINVTVDGSSLVKSPIYGLKITHVDGEKNDTVEYDSSRFTEVNSGKMLYYLDGSSITELPKTESESSYKWQLFAWVRILDGNKVVDMFPATIADDNLYNGMSTPALGDLTNLGEPAKKPAVPIAGPQALQLKKQTFEDAKDQTEVAMDNSSELKPLAIYCNDPRFNWAPEDWFMPNDEGNDVMPANWYSTYIKSQLNGSDDRPRDFFQFVSNIGYLQSMGELYMLPLVRTDYSDLNPDSARSCSFCEQGNVSRYNGNPFSSRTGVDNLANKSYMWKTRCPWDIDDAYDPYCWQVYDRRVVDSIGGSTISPYAENDIFMSVLANTPYDWIVASDENGYSLNDGLDLCFNARSSDAKISWDDLQKIGQNLRSAIINGGSGSWEDNYRNSSGWDQDGQLFGVAVDNLHEVDKKYLYAYWKNCLGNGQQLFLVFVRAEPTVMGAANADYTPAQLGAKAVALVWREGVSSVKDTAENNDGNSSHPHRMRILFYHQFE